MISGAFRKDLRGDLREFSAAQRGLMVFERVFEAFQGLSRALLGRSDSLKDVSMPKGFMQGPTSSKLKHDTKSELSSAS